MRDFEARAEKVQQLASSPLATLDAIEVDTLKDVTFGCEI